MLPIFVSCQPDGTCVWYQEATLSNESAVSMATTVPVSAGISFRVLKPLIERVTFE